MRQGECNPPFSLPHDRLTWDSRNTDEKNDEKDNWTTDWKANKSKYKWTADDDWNAKKARPDDDNWNGKWNAKKSNQWSQGDRQYDSKKHGNGRRHERYRYGKNGGSQRYGDRGGRNKFYYEGLHLAARVGPECARLFIDRHGKPPGRGGRKFHPRKN